MNKIKRIRYEDVDGNDVPEYTYLKDGVEMPSSIIIEYEDNSEGNKDE
jgi:hypothetical protein